MLMTDRSNEIFTKSVEIQEVQTSGAYGVKNRLTKRTNSGPTFPTHTYMVGGLCRKAHYFDRTVHTMVWDCSDYLSEVRSIMEKSVTLRTVSSKRHYWRLDCRI